MLEYPLMSFKGQFYIVSTPIGNLDDITLRAIQVLKSVDVIISEDTRETKKLLDKLSIKKNQISYRDENHDRVKNRIFDLLKSNKSMALVSDSGTPLISDPGFKLINELHKKGYTPVSIPGPSAITSALSVSGLPTDKFVFLGFLPKKKTQRARMLKKYGNTDSTLIIYESPYKVNALLKQIGGALGNRYLCVCRELTKMYEEITRGYTEELVRNKLKEKGEFVVLVAKESFSPK